MGAWLCSEVLCKAVRPMVAGVCARMALGEVGCDKGQERCGDGGGGQEAVPGEAEPRAEHQAEAEHRGGQGDGSDHGDGHPDVDMTGTRQYPERETGQGGGKNACPAQHRGFLRQRCHMADHEAEDVEAAIEDQDHHVGVLDENHGNVNVFMLLPWLCRDKTGIRRHTQGDPNVRGDVFTDGCCA